jgi:hypothetical protein
LADRRLNGSVSFGHVQRHSFSGDDMLRTKFPSVSPALLPAIAVSAVCLTGVRSADAIAGCGGTPPTLSQQLELSRAAVIFRLVRYLPADPSASPDEPSVCTFEVVDVLKGNESFVRRVIDKTLHRFDVAYYGEESPGTEFFAVCHDLTDLSWYVGDKLDDASREYVRRLPRIAPAGTERVAFFVDHLDHPNPLIDVDAQLELARMPFSALIAAKGKLPLEKIRRSLDDPDLSFGRRLLYLRMLGACGRKQDVLKLKEWIKHGTFQQDELQAVIGSYLVLKGSAGMPFIEERFFADVDADRFSVFWAVMALRFVAHETDAVPRDRLAEAFRRALRRDKNGGGGHSRAGKAPRLVGLAATGRTVQSFRLRFLPTPRFGNQLPAVLPAGRSQTAS